MDPTIGWYQPEQFGPAKDLWLHIWEAEKGLDVLTLRNDPVNSMGVRLQQDFLALDTTSSATGTGGTGTGANINTPSSVASFGGGIGIGIGNGNANNGGGNGNGRCAPTATASNGEHRVPHNACCNSYYNPSRRKSDNRASTYGMNYNYDALVGEYGGCPWRVPNKHYSKGVIG